MFKQVIKKCQQWVIWLNIIIILLSLVVLAITFFTNSDREFFWSLVMLCGAFIYTAGSAFFAEILKVMAMHDVDLVNEEIQIKRRNRILWTISYTKIAVICIDGMRSDIYSCTEYKNKIPQACMTIYDTEDVNPKVFCRSKSNTPPYAKAVDYYTSIDWYAYPLNTKHLEILLNKTNAIVYISEQILKAHKDELKGILDNFSDRVTVAYYNKTEKEEKKAPYAAVKDWF